MRTGEKTRRLALCSLLSALGVVLLYLGALIDMLDLTVSALAPIFVAFAVIELKGYWPWLIYLVTAILALLLLPQKSGAVIYLSFTGFYPIAKRFIEEKLPRLLGLIAKLALFNLSLLLLWLAAKLFMLPLVFDMAWYIVIAVLEFTFLLYDYTFTKFITIYIRYWRKRLFKGKGTF